jgi:hypothetical protein
MWHTNGQTRGFTIEELAMLACMSGQELEDMLWLAKRYGDDDDAWLYSTELAARLIRQMNTRPMEPIAEWKDEK